MTRTTSSASTPSALLTVAQTATLLRVSESTIRRLARRGELGAKRVGRQWRIADLDGLAATTKATEGV